MRAFLKKHGGLLAAGLVSSMVVLAMHLRILTYVTAQDPFIYIRLARKLVDASFSPAAILEVFKWMMPGYPLLLAAAIRLAGPFAPYWINLPFVLGLFMMLAWLVRRLYADGLPLVAMTLFGVWLILGGHGLNPHFLLYPFRESPMLFFCLLGFLLVLVAREKERAAWYALAGISFLLAGGIREPALFCVPFVALAIARGCERGRRARALGWFLLPFLPAAGLWTGFSLLKGGWGTAQMSFWAYRLPEGGMIVKGRYAFFSAWPMLVSLRHAMGWSGAVLWAVGLIHAAWKCREALFFFALPGMALLLFYGCHSPHPRYILESLVLLCPLALGGLYVLLTGATTLAERFLQRRLGSVFFVVVLLLFVALISLTARRAGPWGLRVSREGVRQFQSQMRPYEGTNNLVFVDKRCRYLTDALVSYTRVTTADPLLAARFREEARWLFYADPASPAGYYRGESAYQGVSPETVLRHYFDVRTPDASEVVLGANRFVMKDVRPWITTNLVQRLDGAADQGRILWLDFQSATACAKRVTLFSDARQPVRSWTLDPPVSLQPVYLEPGLTGSFVRVEADGAMPSRVIRGIQEAARPFMSELTQSRNLSLMSWFKTPFVISGPSRKYGVSLREGGLLEIPAVRGAENRGLTIFMNVQPGRRENASVHILYKEGRREMARGIVDLNRELIRHRFRIPPRKRGGPRRLELTVKPPLAKDNFLKVMAFGLYLDPGHPPEESRTESP